MNIENAIKLLLSHAASDTGGSRRCAAFLLSLWNGDVYKADLQELLYVDVDIHQAMMNVFQLLYGTNNQLDTYLTEQDMTPVIAQWGDVFRKNDVS